MGARWRLRGGVGAQAGTCLTIPVGTSFQFRALGESPLSACAVTMPPWPEGSEDGRLKAGGVWVVSECEMREERALFIRLQRFLGPNPWLSRFRRR